MQKKRFYVALQEKKNATCKPHSGLSTFSDKLQDAFSIITEFCETSECSNILFCISQNKQDMYKGQIRIPYDGVYNYTYSVYAGCEKELKTTKYNYNTLAA